MSRRLWRGLLAAVLSLTLIAPAAIVPASHAAGGLGTARGYRGVEVSLDGGKTWVKLGQRSLPLLDGARLRSTTGSAVLTLSDGSRVALLPGTSVDLQQASSATEVYVRSGRLMFNLPRDARTEIRTDSARLEPVRKEPMAGEVFVGGQPTTVAVKMSEGSVQVRELAGEKRTMVASLEPVFLPKKPASGAIFSASAPVAAPAGAKGVYTPAGESLGYLGSDTKLVMQPGYTRDLTQPFPRKLVQVAMAKIPEGDRKDGTPLFDVNGGYVGYLSDSGFYSASRVAQVTQPQVAQAQVAQVVDTTATAEEGTNWTPWILGGVAAVVIGVPAGLAASGQFSGNGNGGGGATTGTPATPVSP